MEGKAIQQIKDEVSVKYGFDLWTTLMIYYMADDRFTDLNDAIVAKGAMFR